MGGPGSTRWGMTLTRMTTHGLPRLDVRELARAGCLVPDTYATVSWEGGATITLQTLIDQAPQLVLTYHFRTPHGRRHAVEDTLFLTRTLCTFGGARAWFTCPGCGRRCAILYARLGRFRCRSCLRLAYASTRECHQSAGKVAP
jgi:hypothetical protein